jgi:hypothetical protein
MNQSIHLFLISIFALTSCTTNKEAKQEAPERFKYYKSMDHRTDTVEVQRIQWAVSDRPDFISENDFVKYHNNDDELLNHCFFLDTKDDNIQKFSKEVTDDLQDQRAVRFYGEFFITMQFDNVFPDKVFESMRANDQLSYKPDKDGFKVFLYTKFETVK